MSHDLQKLKQRIDHGTQITENMKRSGISLNILTDIKKQKENIKMHSVSR